MREAATRLLVQHLDQKRAEEAAGMLTEGRWTHDFPIDAELASSFGLPVWTDLPDEVRRCAPTRGRRPSVDYIPMPYGEPERVPERRTPVPRRKAE